MIHARERATSVTDFVNQNLSTPISISTRRRAEAGIFLVIPESGWSRPDSGRESLQAEASDQM